MFPIPWNRAFRKKDGTLVNMEDMGGGGSDLPEHTAEDAGKVLSVDDNNALQWKPVCRNLTPGYSGLSYPYVSNTQWIGYDSKTNYVFLFAVEANKIYFLIKTDSTGNRCKAAFFANKTIDDFMATVDTPSSVSAIFTGVNIVDNGNNSEIFKVVTNDDPGVIAVLTSSESVAATCNLIEVCDA